MNWISVTESLPETGKKVIATFVNQSGKRRTICAHYIARWSVESDNNDDCHDEYSEEKDAYFYCEGWYENIENWGEYMAVHVCEGEITHWMPLPESPEQQAQQPVVPEAKVWNQVEGRDGKLYGDGWNACRDAMLSASQTKAPQPSLEEYVLCDHKGVVINNNLKDSQVLIACPPHTTISVGTVMIACQHPDVIDDGCVICGININPNSDDWRTDLLSAGKEAV